MNYKNVFLGVLFYMILNSVEDAFNLKSLSLVIPAVIIIAFIAFIHGRLKKDKDK